MRKASLLLTGSPVYVGESLGRKSTSPERNQASGFLGFCSGANDTVKNDYNLAPMNKNSSPRMSAKRMQLEQEYALKLENERIKFEKKQEALL